MLFEAKQKETKGRGADRGGEGSILVWVVEVFPFVDILAKVIAMKLPIVENTNYLCYLGIFSC